MGTSVHGPTSAADLCLCRHVCLCVPVRASTQERVSMGCVHACEYALPVHLPSYTMTPFLQAHFITQGVLGTLQDLVHSSYSRNTCFND